MTEDGATRPGDAARDAPEPGRERRGALRATGSAARSVARRSRRALRRDGAGNSGLATLVELCAVNSAGDAIVAVALAGTVFFNVPVGQARGRVALYLLITMAPFALLAPVIGPALDRIHGRRVALAATMLARALLCWELASRHTGLELYPLALGLLVTSRAFGVARAAVTPRVLPSGTTLLSANSRVTLVGALGAGIVAPPALGIGAVIGIGWVLRVGTVIFLAAILLCMQLPPHVDTSKGETAAVGLARSTFGPQGSRFARALGDLPTALRAVLALRALVGFLTLFLAFELRTSGSGKASLAGLAGAALAGQLLGVTIGNRLGRRRPELLIASGLLLATAACLAGTVTYSRPVSLVVALLATTGGALGKLGLDAVIQRDIDDSARASAFARSETALQLSWVAGGAIGLAPLSGRAGLGLAAAGMVMALLSEVVALRRSRRSRRTAPVPEVLRRRQAEAATPPSSTPASPSTPGPRVGTSRPAGSAAGPGGTMVMPFDEP